MTKRLYPKLVSAATLLFKGKREREVWEAPNGFVYYAINGDLKFREIISNSQALFIIFIFRNNYFLIKLLLK